MGSKTATRSEGTSITLESSPYEKPSVLVMAGEELLRAAGTVTKKLAKWLGERGDLDPTAVNIAVERGADAAHDLPKAEKLSRLLFERCRKTTIDADAL